MDVDNWIQEFPTAESGFCSSLKETFATNNVLITVIWLAYISEQIVLHRYVGN